MLKALSPIAFVAGLIISSTANAKLCDYRPSQLLGAGGTAAVAGAGGAAAGVGAAAKAAGVYTLVHATTGATMVGGTWAGASAAGTAGIIGGTAGLFGTVVAVITAPATIIAGAVTVAVIGTFEGACYFADTRITEFSEIDAIVRDIAKTAPPSLFKYMPHSGQRYHPAIRVRDPDASGVRYDVYEVRNLYIVNGMLMHRDWGFNTKIGLVGMIQPPKSDKPDE
ncbi:MAG: hypothetical protein ACK4GO_01065 [Gemmobacter sp.]